GEMIGVVGVGVCLLLQLVDGLPRRRRVGRIAVGHGEAELREHRRPLVLVGDAVDELAEEPSERPDEAREDVDGFGDGIHPCSPIRAGTVGGIGASDVAWTMYPSGLSSSSGLSRRLTSVCDTESSPSSPRANV